jgi:lipopolysaccharide export system protein LptC
MLRNLSATALPLLLLGSLAGLTFWLAQTTELPEEINTGRLRHDPDYFIENFSLRKLDPQGILHYSLVAKRMEHYPDDESSRIDQPKLTQTRPTRPTVVISADRGQLNSDGSEVRLQQNVRIERSASGKQEALVATTSELLALPDEERARTDQPVHIVQGKSKLDGTGMDLDNAARQFNLHHRVSGQFASRHGNGAAPARTTPAAPVTAPVALPASRPETRPASRPVAPAKANKATKKRKGR